VLHETIPFAGWASDYREDTGLAPALHADQVGHGIGARAPQLSNGCAYSRSIRSQTRAQQREAAHVLRRGGSAGHVRNRAT
jgi:hypothetical protein